MAFLIAIAGGCANSEGPASSSGSSDTVTVISNFDYMGHHKEISFHQIPQRVIAARPEVLDVLLALHAEQNVCAAYMTRDQAGRIPELKKLMPNCQFFTNEIDRETALMLKPDFIVGWRWNFRKGSLGDVDFWNQRNVPTYIEENSGPVPAVDPFPPSTVESEMQFMENMGKVFHKEDEAQALVSDIKDTLREKESLARQQGLRKAITMEFMGNKIEVFGDKLLPGDIIRKLGCSNFNYEVPFITREELRMSDADTIFVIYHGSHQDGLNALQNFSSPEFKDIPAVKKGKLVLLPYRYICASNIYTAQCIKDIYAGLYE